MQATEDRQLQLDVEGQPERVETESQEYPAVSTHARSNEADDFNATVGNTKYLLERICNRENMREAYRRVVANKGAGGVDGMQVEELNDWLRQNYDALIERMLNGKYRPKPVRRVEIPKKEKGKVRLLGIPTVVDRMVQQAIAQQLTPIFEPRFHKDSYGFRPNRSAHDALLAVEHYADEGNVWVASMDLERFFDTVNQSKLIQLLSDSLVDKRVVSLIHRFLLAGVVVEGEARPTDEGTPQGGPLSPLLANILLNELDWELERRGHKFVRYADDFIILKKSRKAAERAMATMTTFIEKKLFLKVNRDKSFVAYISDDSVKYLGYAFYCKDDGLHFRVHSKSVSSIKDKVREILSRSNGWSYNYRQYRLRNLINGWVGYFRLADMKSFLKGFDGWVRRKIRCIYWKCWKKNRTKFSKLMECGVKRKQAWMWANSRKAYWRISKSQVLQYTLTNAKLEELGWNTFSKRYLELSC